MAVGTKFPTKSARPDYNELSDDDLERVVGGTTGSNQELDEQAAMGGDAPPPESSDTTEPLPEDEPPLPEDTTGSEPPPPEDKVGSEPPPPEGDAPPPHPEDYVNDFIAPLFEGLEYNSEGPSTWTLPISADQVDAEAGTFVVSADQVGTWDGGLPPEAIDNGDGTYTIHSWPISEVADNGDGTVTLTVDIGQAPGEGGEPPPPEGETVTYADGSSYTTNPDGSGHYEGADSSHSE